MKLLSTNLSPYSARVRAQIYIKGLDIEIAEPNPPLKSEDFLSLYPLGKIPILILNDGSHLCESWTILNYLEDMFPKNPLRPDTPLERAHMGMYAGFTDFLLKDSLFPLFVMLGTKQGDAPAIISNIKTELSKFGRLLGEMPPFDTRQIHLGDISLAMSVYFIVALSKIFGETDLFGSSPRVGAWWDWVQMTPEIAITIKEMETALMARAG